MAIAYRSSPSATKTRDNPDVPSSVALDLNVIIRSGPGDTKHQPRAPRFQPEHMELLEKSLAPAIRLAGHTLDCTSCFVSVLSADGSVIEISHLEYTDAAGTQADGSPAALATWVMETEQPLVLNHPSEMPSSIAESLGGDNGHHRFMCTPLVASDECLGALVVARNGSGKAFQRDDLATLESVGEMAAATLDNLCLHECIVQGYRGTIKALAGAIDAKDPYTCGHSQRVCDYAMLAANALDMNGEARETLEYAATLHDIGKIGVDDAILRKPGRLNPRERAAIESHPVIGAAIVRSIPFLHHTENLILYHHERLDGSGYPHRLAGDSIPLGARIIAVADAFDTMTTERPYHRPMTINEAMMELQRCSGTQFCPTALDAFAVGFALNYRDR